MIKRILSIFLCCLLTLAAVPLTAASEGQYPYPSLYKVYEDFFDISVAVEPGDLEDFPELAKEQFNVIVTENQMKPWIHKGEDTWYWSGADKIINWAEANGKKVRSHVLVYPDAFDSYRDNENAWFYKDENGEPLLDENDNVIDLEKANELTLKRLENHIKTIMERYKGRIYAYDVVNEAFMEKGAERTYIEFLKMLEGTDWITKCFEWAHEADPDAKLIFNENGFIEDLAKQDVIYNKIKELNDAGLPVDLGIQMHNGVEVNLELVENMIKRFSEICDIYITEHDMAISQRVLTDEDTTNSLGHAMKVFETVSYPDHMYDEVGELQARKEGSLFDIFRKYKDSVKCVGFWNITDSASYHAAGRNPLPFDDIGNPKASFYRILDTGMALPRWEESDMLPPVREEGEEPEVIGNEIFDELEDFGKVYSKKNVQLTSYPTFFEDDLCGINCTSDQLDDRYIIYKVPDDRVADHITVNAFVYENTLWSGTVVRAKPHISISADGKEYTSLSDIESWGDEIPKELHNDIAAAKQRRHFKCTLDIPVESGAKYIKIDMNDFDAWWHMYIDDVNITTVADESYFEPVKNGISVEDVSILAHVGEKKIRAPFIHQGDVSIEGYAENNTESEKKILCAMVYKKDDCLERVETMQLSLTAGAGEKMSVTMTECMPESNSVFELLVFDVTDGKLIPIFSEKMELDDTPYYEKILFDDFADFSKMYSYSGFQTFDATDWYFDDVTILEQKSNWSGGSIVYKAEENEVFNNVKLTAYTNVADSIGTIANHGAPYIAVSDDGEAYTVISGGESVRTSLTDAGYISSGKAGSVANTNGAWFTKRLLNVEIPNGARFVKFHLPGPLFTQYHFKLGDITLTSRVEK